MEDATQKYAALINGLQSTDDNLLACVLKLGHCSLQREEFPCLVPDSPHRSPLTCSSTLVWCATTLVLCAGQKTKRAIVGHWSLFLHSQHTCHNRTIFSMHR